MSTPQPAEPPRTRLPTVGSAAGVRAALREFGIIVAGVLCALGAQAWWQAREERGRERDHLRQLVADTRENERRLDEAIAQDSTGLRAAGRIMDVFTTPAAPLAPDTMVEWLSQAARASDLRVVAGNYRAMVGTGELRLVRNDTLRALLAAYSSALDNEADRQRQFRATVTAAAAPMARSMPFMRRAFVGRVRLDEAELARVRRDPEAIAVLFTMQAAMSNRVAGMRNLRDDTRRLRIALQAEPAARP